MPAGRTQIKNEPTFLQSMLQNQPGVNLQSKVMCFTKYSVKGVSRGGEDGGVVMSKRASRRAKKNWKLTHTKHIHPVEKCYKEETICNPTGKLKAVEKELLGKYVCCIQDIRDLSFEPNQGYS